MARTTARRDHPRRLFRDRREAGRVLAELLSAYRGRTDVIVLGLARGGIPVAFEVAAALQAPLDAYIVRKLGAPGREEFAVGALARGGSCSTTTSCAAWASPRNNCARSPHAKAGNWNAANPSTDPADHPCRSPARW
jgi:predicted phosphoribosyltransferase